MPYKLFTPTQPFAGRCEIEWYNILRISETTTPEHLAYRIISCFAAIEQFQQRVYSDILGGSESLATTVFQASVTRQQKRTAILEAAKHTFASPDPRLYNGGVERLKYFERLLKATIPSERLRDRLAHWIPISVTPTIANSLIILDPRHLVQGALPADVSPIVYTQDELTSAYVCVSQLIEGWGGFMGFSRASAGTQYYSAKDHMGGGLADAETVGERFVELSPTPQP